MRFFLFTLLFTASFASAFGQSKVGAVDIDFIIEHMPELDEVRKNLETYAAQLEVDLDKRIDAYQEAIAEYQREEPLMTIAQKREKQEALAELETELQRFQQNGLKLIEIKQQEFMRPLYVKVEAALEKIAKAENFTQVMKFNPDIVYLDTAYDLTPLILQELNIEIPDKE